MATFAAWAADARRTGDAVTYARISREDVGNKDNVEIQTAEACAYAAERGLRVVESFKDNHVSISRRSTKPRHDYERMFDGIVAGRYSIVILTEIERLYRRPRECEDLIDIAEGGRPILILCTDGVEYDLST